MLPRYPYEVFPTRNVCFAASRSISFPGFGKKKTLALERRRCVYDVLERNVSLPLGDALAALGIARIGDWLMNENRFPG